MRCEEMERKKESRIPLGELDTKMQIVKNFVAELFSKTLFQDGKDALSDFSLPQMQTLLTFKEDQEYSIGKLGRDAQVKRSTITNMVDYLESEGIAERFRDSGDRRVVKVRLTEKGREIRKTFSRKRAKEMEKIFSQLSEQDREALLYHLDEAYQILKKV
jgi:DNA-binding MarR family transcriptional regulator